MKTSLLVIVCTHRPRPAYLDATLAALRAQTCRAAHWDLLIVDNASPEPLAPRLDLAWHPTARVIREERLGTAHARHRALREAQAVGAELILFVDDDNVLAPDYIDRGLEISTSWPQLGCWGGQLLPQFEVPPAPWVSRYLNYLAVTALAADQWTNCVASYDHVPPTAGCFLRRAVWSNYLQLLARDPRRLQLGARGDVQVRGEDTDLVLTAIDLGLGVGRFRALTLTHLIPAGRLTATYVANVVEGATLGTGLMEYLRFQRVPRARATKRVDRLLLAWRTARLPEPLRSIRRAELRGAAEARRTVLAWRDHAEARPTPPSSTLTPEIAPPAHG